METKCIRGNDTFECNHTCVEDGTSVGQDGGNGDMSKQTIHYEEAAAFRTSSLLIREGEANGCCSRPQRSWGKPFMPSSLPWALFTRSSPLSSLFSDAPYCISQTKGLMQDSTNYELESLPTGASRKEHAQTAVTVSKRELARYNKQLKTGLCENLLLMSKTMKDLTETQDGVLIYNLTIKDVQPIDDGHWRCEVSNSVGRTSALCDIRVFGKDTAAEFAPDFEKKLDNVITEEKHNVLMECSLKGNPQPTLLWYKDDKLVSNSARNKITSLGQCQLLEIFNIRNEDAGIYKCQAENSAGYATTDAKLYVQERPVKPTVPEAEVSILEYICEKKLDKKFINNSIVFDDRLWEDTDIMKFCVKWKEDPTLAVLIHLKNKCTVEGMSVRLNLFVSGLPPFQANWFKDGKEIFDSGRHYLKSMDGVIGLEIPCSCLEDTGYFTCQVKNGKGTVFSSCYLQVEPVLDITNTVVQKPIFVTPLKRQTVKEGYCATFQCVAKGNPAPGFKWYKDGMEIQDSERIRTTTSQKSGMAILEIQNSNINDVGLYCCEAHSFAGRARSMVRLSVIDQFEWTEKKKAAEKNDLKTIKVEKHIKDTSSINHFVADYNPGYTREIYRKVPEFKKGLPESVSVREKGRLLLECCINGNPKPEVMWFKGNKQIESKGQFLIMSFGDWHGLEILEVTESDADIYTCRAVSASGNVESSCKLEISLPKGDLQHDASELHSLEIFGQRNFQELLIQTHVFGEELYLAQIHPSCHLLEITELCQAPYFIQQLSEEIHPLELDENITIECIVGGEPLPKVLWFHDGKLLKDSSNVTQVWDPDSRTARVILKHPRSSDAGKYMCLAYTDMGGYAETTTVVHIERIESLIRGHRKHDTIKEPGPPDFKVKLRDKSASPGRKIKLECLAEGFPQPEVKWYKNDLLLEPVIDKYTITSNTEGLHSLQIVAVDLFDSDCYKCEAINKYGRVSTCAHIKIGDGDDVDGDTFVRPYFLEPLHTIILDAGDDAVLRCVAEGNPKPKFKWQKDVLDINKSDRIQVTVNDNETMLCIKKVQPEDAGLYFCTALNKVGRVKSCATLKVIEYFDTKETLNCDETSTKEEFAAKVGTLKEKVSGLDENVGSSYVDLFEEEGYREIEEEQEQAHAGSEQNRDSNDRFSDQLSSETTESIKDPKEVKEPSHKMEVFEEVKEVKLVNEALDKIVPIDGEEIKIEDVRKEVDVKNNECGQDETKPNVLVSESDSSAGNEERKVDDYIKVEPKPTDSCKPIVDDNTDGEQSKTLANDTNPTKLILDNSIDIKDHSAHTQQSAADNKLSSVSDVKVNGKHEDACDIKNAEEEQGREINQSKKPRFILKPWSKWVEVHTDVALSVTVEACDGLKVVWYRNGEKIEYDDRYSLVCEAQ
ncbi:hypothetical protein ACJMK2_016604, partial [Sinanodonta woodiana]